MIPYASVEAPEREASPFVLLQGVSNVYSEWGIASSRTNIGLSESEVKMIQVTALLDPSETAWS